LSNKTIEYKLQKASWGNEIIRETVGQDTDMSEVTDKARKPLVVLDCGCHYITYLLYEAV